MSSNATDTEDLTRQKIEEAKQKRAKLKRSFLSNVEALIWSLLAFVIVFYGTGEHDMITLVIYDPRIHRPALHLGLTAVTINALVFSYLQIWVKRVQKQADPERAVSWAIPVGAATLITAGISFIVALWGIYGWFTAPVVFVLFLGFFMLLHLLPPFEEETYVYKPSSKQQ